LDTYRVECFALFDRVFLVIFDLVKGDHVPDGEEDEKGRENQGYYVGKRQICESHQTFFAF
jgi:hypothetical protein